MFHAVQWTNVPPGASGSFTDSASDRVPGGGADQRSGGETPLPSHVYGFGIDAPA
jgi:hypothetical protein